MTRINFNEQACRVVPGGKKKVKELQCHSKSISEKEAAASRERQRKAEVAANEYAKQAKTEHAKAEIIRGIPTFPVKVVFGIFGASCSDPASFPKGGVEDPDALVHAEKPLENAVVHSVAMRRGGDKVDFAVTVPVTDKTGATGTIRAIKIGTVLERMIIPSTGSKMTLVENEAEAKNIAYCKDSSSSNCSPYVDEKGVAIGGKVAPAGIAQKTMDNGALVYCKNQEEKDLSKRVYLSMAEKALKDGRKLYEDPSQKGDYYVSYKDSSKSISAGYYLCDKDGVLKCVDSSGKPSGTCKSDGSDIKGQSSLYKYVGDMTKLLNNPLYTYYSLKRTVKTITDPVSGAKKDVNEFSHDLNADLSKKEYVPGAAGADGIAEQLKYAQVFDETRTVKDVLDMIGKGLAPKQALEQNSYPVSISNVKIYAINSAGEIDSKVTPQSLDVDYKLQSYSGADQLVINYPQFFTQGAGSFLLTISGTVDRKGLNEDLGFILPIKAGLFILPKSQAPLEAGVLPSNDMTNDMTNGGEK